MLADVKKVMHITYDMRIGGTEMVIKNIVEGLDEKRFNQSIFCIEQPIGPWGEALQKSGTSIYSHPRKPGFDFSLIRSLRQQIKQSKVDILHCHQYTPWVYGVLAALGLQTQVIFTEHGRFYPDTSSWKRRLVNPIFAALTKKITAISQATKQALVNFEFLGSNRIDVIYNGIHPLQVDINKLSTIKSELKIAEGELVFGTIARLDPIKNHEMMINAFAKVISTNANCKLVIVGDGELMETLQSQVKALKISSKVIFTGYIAYPKEYLALIDIFLLSSFSEGTSMTLLEAMSLGKPCIATDAGGNKEIVSHEETGLITDNDDMEGFANAMVSLSENTEQMYTFGHCAKQRFDNTFTDRIMAKHYEASYER